MSWEAATRLEKRAEEAAARLPWRARTRQDHPRCWRALRMPRRSGRLPVLPFHTMSRQALIFPDTVYRAGAKRVHE